MYFLCSQNYANMMIVPWNCHDHTVKLTFWGCDQDMQCFAVGEHLCSQWLNPPVASDYVSVVYFSWLMQADISRVWQTGEFCHPWQRKIHWHTLFDSLTVAWSRIISSDVNITPSYQDIHVWAVSRSVLVRSVWPQGFFPFPGMWTIKVSCDSASPWLCAEAQLRRLTNTCAHSQTFEEF